MNGKLPGVSLPVLVKIRPEGFPEGGLICGTSDVSAAISRVFIHASALVVVTDENVAGLQAGFIDSLHASVHCPVHPFVFPPGEKSKSMETVMDCFSFMAAQGCDRNCVIVGFGGGVATDIAGMVALLWMRGVSLVQVPTSLLAMADAAIGGKCAVNLPEGRNLAGCWKFAEYIYIRRDFLNTLPADEVAQGLVEIIKTGFVTDESLLKDVETCPDFRGCPGPCDTGWLYEIACKAAMAKAAVVARDPVDSGARRSLNFGHTVGHAIESASGLTIAHGLAVAVGMTVEMAIAVRSRLIDVRKRNRLLSILAAVGVSVSVPDVSPETVFSYMSLDKKNAEGVINMAVPTGDGSADGPANYAVVPVSRSLFMESWND